MKKTILLTIAIVGLAMSAKSQMGPIALSLDLAKPTGEFGEVYGIGYGFNWSYEEFVSNKVGITIHLGSTIITPKNGESRDTIYSSIYNYNDNYFMLHAQLGLRYYFSSHDEGWYAMYQWGASRNTSTVTLNDDYYGFTYAYEDVSSYRLSTLSLGYKAGRKWDYSFRYNTMKYLASSSPDPARFIGFRISRTLFGDRRAY